MGNIIGRKSNEQNFFYFLQTQVTFKMNRVFLNCESKYHIVVYVYYPNEFIKSCKYDIRYCNGAVIVTRSTRCLSAVQRVQFNARVCVCLGSVLKLRKHMTKFCNSGR